MIDQPFIQLLLLLGSSVAVVVLFQKLHIPSSLGYLLVGVLFGAHTPGPVIEIQQIREVAEFGIVFLQFTIGLSFSLPQIHALRGQVLGLGTGQVLLTTAVIGEVSWWLGLPPATAFVIGAVFAQSSTTIISKQLAEQGEEHSRHGRLGLAMSVFQDLTAVPFVVIIPVLSVIDADAGVLFEALGWALAKAVLAFLLVLFLGRWLLRPLFHAVAARRSAELFTLAVLFVSLLAAWTASNLGLSMAFGAFLVGMMLGETEFRHQIESTITPFRDVLIGLFFVSIGMLFDPSAIPQNWQWALAGVAAMRVTKTLLVALIVRLSGLDGLTAWRTGFLLAVGGEFGFALLAIALDAHAVTNHLAQIVFTSVLFSMLVAPFLIRYNHALARLFVRKPKLQGAPETYPVDAETRKHLRDHTIICPFTRVVRRMQHQRAGRYRLLREFYRGEEIFSDAADLLVADGLRSVSISSGSCAVGKKLTELALAGVTLSSLVRQGRRESEPLDIVIAEDDVVVLFGAPGDLDRAERQLLG